MNNEEVKKILKDDVDRCAGYLEAKDAEHREEIQEIFRKLRDKWCYEGAHGHPVFSLKLDDWVKFLVDAGLGDEDWWELKEEQAIKARHPKKQEEK